MHVIGSCCPSRESKVTQFLPIATAMESNFLPSSHQLSLARSQWWWSHCLSRWICPSQNRHHDIPGRCRTKHKCRYRCRVKLDSPTHFHWTVRCIFVRSLFIQPDDSVELEIHPSTYFFYPKWRCIERVLRLDWWTLIPLPTLIPERLVKSSRFVAKSSLSQIHCFFEKTSKSTHSRMVTCLT